MKQTIGLALPFGLFEAQIPEKAAILSSAFGGVGKLLNYCSHAVQCVELRTIRKHSTPQDVVAAVRTLQQHGLTTTIHGTLDEVEAFFAPYRDLFSADLQPLYNVTVHPSVDFDTTVSLLKAICDEIDKHHYPFFITLENQRITAAKSFGRCEDIMAVVNEIQSPHLAVCFDFGHQYSNVQNGIDDPITEEFLSRVRHTHIHSFCEGRTHFPLDCGETALDAHLTALERYQYEGVLSLELSADRYHEKFDVRKSVEHSVSTLQTAVTQINTKSEAIPFYRHDYFKTVRDLKTRFDAAENAVALVGPSDYVIKLGGTRIAVDFAPTVLSIGAAEQAFLAEWINDFDAYILTHSHRDHYDASFFSTLSPNLPKLVPDFMELIGDNMVNTHHDTVITINDVTIRFFESGHKLGMGGVPEYGFCLTYNGESFVFPCDVRNYEFPYPTFSNVRFLFSHLWLGKKALNLYDNPYIDTFCRFVNSFGAESCCVAHLNDIHRTIDNMWSDVHANEVCRKLANAKLFKVGDLIEF